MQIGADAEARAWQKNSECPEDAQNTAVHCTAKVQSLPEGPEHAARMILLLLLLLQFHPSHLTHACDHDDLDHQVDSDSRSGGNSAGELGVHVHVC